ncbi:MAG: NAD(P)/FAD-dependent oxidoreductase [Phycisphaerales bacterium JB039]
MEREFDVAIVGGGPAGSTAACLLRKYDPQLRVLVLEKEQFPREHIGESQLPAVSGILHEMGCWDKVEAANFPVKLGATFTWGADDECWDFDFYPVEDFRDEARPAKYAGQRRFTAFQVERAIYDKILLDHARELGCEVREQTAVREVVRDGDACGGLKLDSGETVTARWYLDASGAAGLFRRSFEVGSDAPKELRNIAIYDYWNDARWAVEIGVGGTRIQVRSLPFGWIWFIPLGPKRASVGLVCPAEYYRQRGLGTEALYLEALEAQPQIKDLLSGATREGVRTVKDWSHISDRLCGDNWMLIGEAAGFADPILSAGLTVHQGSAREAAFTILEIERGEIDATWLKKAYDEKTRRNIRQHIQFAQYWYAANSRFTQLKEHCQKIAAEAGLSLKPQQAWSWLARGGFTNQGLFDAKFGSFDFGSAKRLVEKFSGEAGGGADFRFEKFNAFKLNLLGAKKTHLPDYQGGRVRRIECYERAGRILPITGFYENMMRLLKVTGEGRKMLQLLAQNISAQFEPASRPQALSDHMLTLEAMLEGGWVTGRYDKKLPPMPTTDKGGRTLRATEEGLKAIGRAAGS